MERSKYQLIIEQTIIEQCRCQSDFCRPLAFYRFDSRKIEGRGSRRRRQFGTLCTAVYPKLLGRLLHRADDIVRCAADSRKVVPDATTDLDDETSAFYLAIEVMLAWSNREQYADQGR